MPHLFKNQKTIKKSVSLTGIGVHSGLPSTVELLPLAANMGIIIERSDLKVNNQIFASITNVVDTQGATTLANEYGVTISTVEHLMAALAVYEITNVLIRINGPETPIMDGSAQPFMRLLDEAGVCDLEAPQTILTVKNTVELVEEKRWIRLEPSDHLCFDVSQDFGGREGLQPQSCTYSIDRHTFDHEISLARSFGFYEDAQKLYAAGLAKGSSLENAVVFKNGAVMNPEGLHYENEMVRHKVLDAVGDFFLCGHVMHFKCSGHNIGHEFNNMIMRALLSQDDAFDIQDAHPAQKSERIVGTEFSSLSPSFASGASLEMGLSPS